VPALRDRFEIERDYFRRPMTLEILFPECKQRRFRV
jgi:hypothetical protein